MLAAFGAFAVNVAIAQAPSAASLSDSALEARTSEIAARLRCPVCQGESIQDSPAELAQQMRAVVKQQLSEGRSREEIEAYFVARYGEWILLEPTMTGLNKALYAFPIVLVLGGLALIVVLVKRWTSAPAEASAEEPAADADSLAGRA
jgi:cytochrome c-type biogenesis protein CcmH